MVCISVHCPPTRELNAVESLKPAMNGDGSLMMSAVALGAWLVAVPQHDALCFSLLQ